MHVRAPAIVVATRHHGETAVIARVLTQKDGLVAAYVAGGRGRNLRPVVIPGNVVEADIRVRSANQLPFAKLELVQSRGPWLSEPLPASAIAWVTALTACALPERSPYPNLYTALGALLDAICAAPSARGWINGLVTFETLMLREMGYGGSGLRCGLRGGEIADLSVSLDILGRLEEPIATYLIAEQRADVMAARTLLLRRLSKMIGEG